jgi:hypothetical protein
VSGGPLAGRAAVAAALLLCALLAGCGGKGATTVEVAPGQVVELTAPPKPSRGIVSGIVGDDAVYPLANATIFILGLGLNTTTDPNGRFAIVDVPPGIYILEGSLKNHASAQTTVDVQAGEVAKAVLLLPRVPPTDPYHATVQHETFIDAWAAFLRMGGNTSTLDIVLDPSEARTMVLEATWSGTVVATGSTAFDFSLQTSDNKEVVAGPAGNPFSVHLDARILPPGRQSFLFSVQPRLDAVLLQSEGRLYATVFYNAEAPPQWSMLAGDT